MRRPGRRKDGEGREKQAAKGEGCKGRGRKGGEEGEAPDAERRREGAREGLSPRVLARHGPQPQ
eukprot:7188162-Pyramimonas_sp.AAC.1